MVRRKGAGRCGRYRDNYTEHEGYSWVWKVHVAVFGAGEKKSTIGAVGGFDEMVIALSCKVGDIYREI